MTEAQVALQISHYIRYTYGDDVLFHWDFGSGLNKNVTQRRQNQFLNRRGWPDLFIAEPRHGRYGLFIELKRDGTRIWLASGIMTADRHVREQEAELQKLRNRGYRAEFAVGYSACCALIDEYLATPERKHE